MTTEFNIFQQIKREFFALRNGVIADTLRRSGAPYKIIFGLNIPQIKEVASHFGPDAGLARRLWENTSTRESLLMAPMIMPPEAMEAGEARRWIAESPAAEVTDILCHSLLRRRPDSFEFASEIAKSEEPMLRYAAMRLLWHHIQARTDEVKAITEAELARNDKLTAGPARQIIDEIAFWQE